MACAVALVGNPNCGKTTLFNALTGQHQVVGNWSGVTVQRKEAPIRGREGLTLVDLPGIYALSPYSMEESVALDYLLDGDPSVILNIVDGTNIERNLYLTVQLLELGKPIIVAVNMMDEVQAQGGAVDCALLAALLGAPVFPVSARRGEGASALLEAVGELSRSRACAPPVRYGASTQRALAGIAALAEPYADARAPVRFYAGQLLEGDARAQERLCLPAPVLAAVEDEARRLIATARWGDRETVLADERYRHIQQMVEVAVRKGRRAGVPTLTQRIDRVALSPILALPLFAALLFVLFSATFGPVGTYLKELVGSGVTLFARAARMLLDQAQAPAWTYGLILDAVIGGVGGVLAFLPQILLLFLFLSLLEDSGYMARAAFLMDRLLHKIGLSGKSFIPMLMGFGCTTPAVMAARAMENERDRRMTILLTPFMSCGARLPIYALFCGAFFPGREGAVVFALYSFGLLVAVLCGLVLRRTVLAGEDAPFVMELPPYRLPSLVSTLGHMWDKCRDFLVKAGTVIFSMSVVIWLLQSFTPVFTAAPDPSLSIFACLGRLLAPALAPLGFGDWQAAVALLAGLVAKESVVGTLGVLYGAHTPAALTAGVAAQFTPLSAVSFMVFSLLYMPCISAFVSICREMNSVKWAVFGAMMQTGAAYLAAWLIFTVGGMLIQ